MLIARQKRKTNFAEYILYMWQIEDLLRALNFSIEKVEELIINQYKSLSSKDRDEMLAWYQSLIDMMQEQSLQKGGHTLIVRNAMDTLNDFHDALLKNKDENPNYYSEYQKTKPAIDAIRSKSNIQSNDIEICLTALYGLMTIKMKQKEISKETEVGIQMITQLVRLLTKSYHETFTN